MGCCVGDCCVGYCGFCCIMDFSSGSSCCVGHTSVSNDSVENAKKITEEFNKMKDEYENKAAVQERDLMDQLNATMDKFIDELVVMNKEKYSGRTLNINIEAIRKKREALSQEVVGFIGTRLHDRIVTTDPELAPILKEKDDKKRNANVKKFCEKVLKDAKSDLKTKIKDTVKEQELVVRKELENRLAEINNSLAQSTAAYNELLAATEKDVKEQERLKLQYMYEYDIYNVIDDQVGIFDDIKVGVHPKDNKIKVKQKKE